MRRLALLLFLCAAASAVNAQKSVHVSTTVLDSYVGEYSRSDDPDWRLSFFREDDHLYCEGPRMPRARLNAESDTVFVPDKGQLHYTFVPGSSSAPASVRVAGETTWDLVRISTQPVPNHFRPYKREDLMIPMRDGVRLSAILMRPADTDDALPFLLERTPYGIEWDSADQMVAASPELARSGYIFVFENIRGRYKSEGKFVMMRPMLDHRAHPSSDVKATQFIDESTDTYDTVAWLLKHVPRNNGRVGVFGVSYPGFLAAAAGIDPHPAIRAISPQAPMTDVWIGDDFFHNGAFRQTYGYDYVLGMEANKESTLGDPDEYTNLLRYGSFSAAIHASGVMSGTALDPASDKSTEKKPGPPELLPTWKGFLEHPAYDDYWRSRALENHLSTVAVPTLEVGGFWDQEDLWGPQAEYAALEPHNQPADPAHRVFMILGPWRHGSWWQTTRHLDAVNFGEPVGDEFRERIQAPFFAFYLKDERGFSLANTASYQTGSERWMYYDQWPPKNVTPRSLYLGADGTAGFEKPSDPSAFKAYISDPADPVPYRRRPIEATYGPGSHWYTWLVQDQRFVDGRKDVATWTTPPLDHDLTITGDVVADLVASTSGTDSDWVVKLIDVFPDADQAAPGACAASPCLTITPALNANPAGYELMIADEIFRGRYRTSFEHPEAIPANTPEAYKFSLHAADHVFLKGHRIMVQVQSSWFPLYDRNPQTFVPNIMTAQPADYRPAEQHIYAGSYIELPIPR